MQQGEQSLQGHEFTPGFFLLSIILSDALPDLSQCKNIDRLGGYQLNQLNDRFMHQSPALNIPQVTSRRLTNDVVAETNV
jgi:hypothetical protein